MKDNGTIEMVDININWYNRFYCIDVDMEKSLYNMNFQFSPRMLIKMTSSLSEST